MNNVLLFASEGPLETPEGLGGAREPCRPVLEALLRQGLEAPPSSGLILTDERNPLDALNAEASALYVPLSRWRGGPPGG